MVLLFDSWGNWRSLEHRWDRILFWFVVWRAVYLLDKYGFAAKNLGSGISSGIES